MLVSLAGGPVPGRTGKGRASGATTKNPPVRREGFWNTYSCTREVIGGTDGTGKSNIVEDRIIASKSNIIEGVAVSGRHCPTTTSSYYQPYRSGRVIYQAPGTQDRKAVAANQASVERQAKSGGRPVKVHCC